MLFNTLEFLIFAVLFFAGFSFLRLRPNSVRHVFIAGMSLIFYGWWDFRFVPLLLLSAFTDYIAVEVMSMKGRKKRYLATSLAINLSVLIFFKYFNMGFMTFNSLRELLGFAPVSSLFTTIILPAGISFYTFQSMSYSLDYYKGHVEKADGFIHFLAYLSLFPQLIAGPIERASHLLPQLKGHLKPTEAQYMEGLQLIVFGFFKKTFIADNLAHNVNMAFQNMNQFESMSFWWFTMVLFSFQILFDFSGYSDIARGLAKWLGMDFIVNFNRPYTSQSFKEFWSRWHISLSTWFRDYVYIPLGGNKFHGVRNTWITMLISGLWHGASWNFVLWGAIHAGFLSLERKLNKMGTFFPRVIILLLVVLSWVPFRAKNFSDTLNVYAHMFDLSHFFNASDFAKANRVIVALAFAILLEFVTVESTSVYKRFRLPVLLVMGLLAIFYAGPGQTFIYFQF